MGADDGNGWVECGCGALHWGRFGAAGLLLHRGGPHGQVLLQLRAPWVHQGGTWALPGGAADSHESVVEAALREAHEEAGVAAEEVEVLGTASSTDHGDWSYTTVLARFTGAGTGLGVANPESVRLDWTDLDRVALLDLHPAFARGWPRLRARLAALLDGAD